MATLSAKKRREREKARAARAHDKYVQKAYGLQEGEYARLLEAQDGRCAICRRVARQRRLAVDHDHSTGRIRALLCQRCNQYLGHWEFDPIMAHNAAIYLALIAAEYGDAYAPVLPKRSMEPSTPPASRPLHVPIGGLRRATA